VAVAAINAALFGRERTGEGAFIDASLFDAALPFMTVSWVEAVTADATQVRGGLAGKLACYNVYRARDGEPVALAALEPKFWANFCAAIERPDLVDGYTAPERQPYLLRELPEVFALRPADEWAALLENADCCFTRVNRPEDALDDPHVRARGSLSVTENGIPVLRSPIRMDGDSPAIAPAPGYGEHTHAVLSETGFSDDEIASLFDAGVIGGN
jgi:crotonobetainyl-CoA:carnitine CoA-transferase CaiB-like acyl-CoA transferase